MDTKSEETVEKKDVVPATPPYIVGGYPCTRDPNHKWPEYQPKED